MFEILCMLAATFLWLRLRDVKSQNGELTKKIIDLELEKASAEYRLSTQLGLDCRINPKRLDTLHLIHYDEPKKSN